jgi:hypothetical protein
MKIRTQLILAFFVLAILPLTGIVLYSYWSSLDAVRAAVEEDGRALTEEMDERLASVRRDLDLRFASLAQVPLHGVSCSLSYQVHLCDHDVVSRRPDCHGNARRRFKDEGRRYG